MPSVIQRMSMGVSATPAATNQNCVSERLRIGMMSHVDRPVERNRVVQLYLTLNVLIASSLASQTHPIVLFFSECLI
jgi:hypothetical protein